MPHVSAHGVVERRESSTSLRATAWRGESALTAWTRTFVSMTNTGIVEHVVEGGAGIDRDQQVATVEARQRRQFVLRYRILGETDPDEVLGGSGRRHASPARVGFEPADERLVQHQGGLHAVLPYHPCRIAVNWMLPDNEPGRALLRITGAGGHPMDPMASRPCPYCAEEISPEAV